MKYIIKRIIIFLLLVALFISVGIPCVISSRGNVDDYIVSKEFCQSIVDGNAKKAKNDVRIMSTNLLVHYESWGGTDARKRAKMYFKMTEKYSPDVIAVQEMCDQWYCCIVKNMKNYRMLFMPTSGIYTRMTGILYNKNKVELIEKGQMKFQSGDDFRLRRIVWGLFKEKSTNKKFVVMSSHFDLIREGQEKAELKVMKSQASEEISCAKSLFEKYNVSVFCAGDFNAMDKGGYDDMYNAPSIYDELADTLTDTKYIAKKKTSGNSQKVKKPTYDHIFLKGSAKVNRYAILSDSAMDAMSDHYPIFVDVSLK